MTEIKITSEEKKEETKGSEKDIKETLRAADEYKRIKEENDKLEREILRQEELKAKMSLGGRSLGGTTEETPEEKARKEAEKILAMFK